MEKHTITIDQVENYRKGRFNHVVASSRGNGSNKSLVLVTSVDPDLMNGCAVRYEVFNQNEIVFTSQDLNEAIEEYNKYP